MGVDEDSDEQTLPSIGTLHVMKFAFLPIEMESEDEVASWNEQPYLRLYEEEENDLRLVVVVEPDSTTVNPRYTQIDTRLYVPFRFFGIIKGFHTGSLDLTGRHRMRYECQMNRLSKFVSELCELDPRAIQHSGVGEPEHIGEGKDHCELLDESLWSSFAQKWGFPPTVDHRFMVQLIHRTFALLKRKPSPIFQRICLVDLPVELLELIFGHASRNNARLLSSTCRLLHQIGSRSINTTRSLVVVTNPDWITLRAYKGKERQSRLCDLALASLDRFLSLTRFLLSSRDLTDAIQHLSVNDGSHAVPSHAFYTDSLPNFYSEIHRSIVHVLQSTTRLATFTISNFQIWPELLASISHIRSLQSVSFLDCWCAYGLIVGSNESVLNLHMTFYEEFNDNVWYTMVLFPQLRTLSVSGSYEMPTSSPHAIFDDANPFLTLERVSLCNMDPFDIWPLSTWMNATNMNLKLTHLKVETKSGMPEEGVFGLIQSLGMAPNLQILVLEGLRSGSLDLITLIATTCSNLLGLTLILRHNARQCKTRLALWPHTLAEYALRFSSFTRLRYFAWNFLTSIDLDPTPAVMVQFESGFPDLGTEEWEELHNLSDTEYFDDFHLIAVPFAAYCSTLQTFVITAQLPLLVCKIDRSRGAVDISTVSPKSMREETRGWNTEWSSWSEITHKQVRQTE